MDTVSLRQAARQLGTSAPRVRRALERLGLAPGPAGRGRPLRIEPRELALLREDLGPSPVVTGLSRGEAKVLAALLRAPLGVVSARALARRAGVSPTTAARALVALERRGFVRREAVTLAEGRARRATIWRAVADHPALARMWPSLSRIPSNREPRHERDTRVPVRLRHLFWTGDASCLRLPEDAVFVARRLLDLDDPEAIAWAADNIAADAWRQAAGLRGVTPRGRALADALAAAAGVRLGTAHDGPSGGR